MYNNVNRATFVKTYAKPAAKSLVVFLLVGLISAGSGGGCTKKSTSGGGSSDSGSSYAGVYQVTVSTVGGAKNGSMDIAADGSVEIVVPGSDAGTGTGSVNASGSIDVSASGVNGVQGTIRYTGTVTGSLKQVSNGTYQVLFGNTVAGTGTWTARCTAACG